VRNSNSHLRFASLILCLLLTSCSSNNLDSQSRPRVTETPAVGSLSTPEQPSAPEEEFDLSTISSACVKQFPGIMFSIDDKKSDDMVIRNYVIDVQELLRLMYETNFLAVDPGPADGVFGPMTDRSVRNYQQIMNITVDGLVGQETWLTFPQACEMIAMEISDHSGLS
jgi:peptidoglycan hydrolase-like protein with peptidoglycan-binding domain